jgi:hypothetical protein
MLFGKHGMFHRAAPCFYWDPEIYMTGKNYRDTGNHRYGKERMGSKKELGFSITGILGNIFLSGFIWVQLFP